MRSYRLYIPIYLLMGLGCSSAQRLDVGSGHLPLRLPMADLISSLDTMGLPDREKVLKRELFSGNIPVFLQSMSKIEVSIAAESGETIRAHYFVTPDYLSVGSNAEFFRIPLTPHTAQQIADKWGCFLPTRKMVDDIYRTATVKLDPIPLTEERERMATFWQHHQLIEYQRKARKGLIAGIKKDVVISEAVDQDSRPDRVAIYGWHKLDGTPIQRLYVGHANSYVDYSHGIRLVYSIIYVNGRQMHYTDVLGDPVLRKLLCDEDECNFHRYAS